MSKNEPTRVYDEMSQDDFSGILFDILGEYTGAQLVLEVPDILPDAMEHFNNEVLGRWTEAQEAEAKDFNEEDQS